MRERHRVYLRILFGISMFVTLCIQFQALIFKLTIGLPSSDPSFEIPAASVFINISNTNETITSSMYSKATPPNRTTATPVERKPPPENKKKKRKMTSIFPPCHLRHQVIDQINVANVTQRSPKILCFVLTYEQNHRVRVKAIQETWGKRCDKLLVASNVTDETYNAVRMKSDSSYLGLWDKLNETIQYVWDHYRDDGYDWVYKADDDTYLIVENLKEYLASGTIQRKHRNNTPLVFGRRYSSPRYRNLANRSVYFGNPVNKAFGRRFYKKINKNRPVIYNYGGPGFAMNFPYVEKFLEVMKSPDTVFGKPPEDQAHGVVMAYHGLWPQNTRDQLGRERFHPENPDTMFGMSEERRALWDRNHRATGGLSTGIECCSSQSIAFHHMTAAGIRALDNFLYKCRGLD